MSGTAGTAPRGGIARVSRRVMNLAYILTQNARRHGDRPGFIWNEKAWSWRHIDQNVSALAAALAARGIGKGDRILVHSKNCDEMFWSMFAAFRLGAVWVPTNFRLMPDEVGYLAAASGAKALNEHPLIEISREEVAGLPPADWSNVIVATGPLTSAPLADAIRQLTDENALAFFDAIAPIVHKDSIDMSVAWFQSRYDKVGPGGTGADYINCPMTKEQYDAFVAALLDGEKVDFKDWETNTPYFDGCLPVEVMAERGHETLRHGPMKPVGLTNPHNPTVKPYAIVQLRQDNKLGTLYNIVGFQTKLKHGAQQRVFRTIPGLENAEFARLGGLHRNTFLNSPKLLDAQLRLRAQPRLRFAGQMTGCEGYVESASVGLIAGLCASADMRGAALPPPPATTALGALLGHITGGHIETIDAGARSFQPMNINFGLFPPLASAPTKKPDGSRLRGNEKTVAKKQAISARALADLDHWIAEHLRVAAAA